MNIPGEFIFSVLLFTEKFCSSSLACLVSHAGERHTFKDRLRKGRIQSELEQGEENPKCYIVEEKAKSVLT